MTPPETTSVAAIDVGRIFPVPLGPARNAWLDPEAVRTWFAPHGYQVTACTLDPRVGGTWRVDFLGPGGHVYTEHGSYLAIDETRIVLTLTQVDGGFTGPETTVTVRFTEVEDGTRVRMTQTGYTDSGHRDGNDEGWQECFDLLGRSLAGDDPPPSAEAEIRALFAEWLAASSRKDIDGAMAPIAADILSYEHSAPLAYRGVEAIRPECQAGFDKQGEDFRWEIPDLEVLVSGDLAVTWGLNRMSSAGGTPEGDRRVMWSRGTRVFARRDGRWQMIHQHVSFPAAADGTVALDATP